ncbi:Uma2 family endonuclease [Streptomyces sp. HNM0645]|nr:Uma2 family endonuclease [Streptomyces sp. HNM0645]MDI9883919.1 Uma2 family endonuclease [Streptomyces sp. HNM0645]
MREDARKEGKRYSFEDVLLISEVVSTSSARKDYDDCTAKYGRYGIPIYLVVDPYAQEVVLHTQPTATGYIAAHTHKYGTGKFPIPLADGRTFTSTSTNFRARSPRRTPADEGLRPGRARAVGTAVAGRGRSWSGRARRAQAVGGTGTGYPRRSRRPRPEGSAHSCKSGRKGVPACIHR